MTYLLQTQPKQQITMKHLLKLFLPLIALLFIGTNHAEAAKTDTVKIKTQTVCGMCKARLEKALAYEKGVENFTVDIENDIITVAYKEKKTSPEQLREAIAAVGHPADDVQPTEEAYNELPNCCRYRTLEKH